MGRQGLAAAAGECTGTAGLRRLSPRRLPSALPASMFPPGRLRPRGDVRRREAWGFRRHRSCTSAAGTSLSPLSLAGVARPEEARRPRDPAWPLPAASQHSRRGGSGFRREGVGPGSRPPSCAGVWTVSVMTAVCRRGTSWALHITTLKNGHLCPRVMTPRSGFANVLDVLELGSRPPSQPPLPGAALAPWRHEPWQHSSSVR